MSTASNGSKSPIRFHIGDRVSIDYRGVWAGRAGTVIGDDGGVLRRGWWLVAIDGFRNGEAVALNERHLTRVGP